MKSPTPRDPFQCCLSPNQVPFIHHPSPPSQGSSKGHMVSIFGSSEKGGAAVTTECWCWKGNGVCSLALSHSRPWAWAAAASDQGGGRPLIVTLCNDYEVSSLYFHPAQTKGGSAAPSFSPLPVSLDVLHGDSCGPEQTRWRQRCSIKWEMGRRPCRKRKPSTF